MALAAAFVDQAPQRLEEFGDTVDLIQDHQTVLERVEKERRVRQLRAVARRFRVDVDPGSTPTFWRALVAPRTDRLFADPGRDAPTTREGAAVFWPVPDSLQRR